MQPTQNQQAIYNIITTSTGSSLGDSGGVYGRHWERNQKIPLENFIDDPEVHINFTHYRYGGRSTTEHTTENGIDITTYHFDPSPDRQPNTEYSYTISLFHWLDHYFDLVDDDIIKESKTSDDLDDYLTSIAYQKGDTHNSYNGESNMSQVYQLTPVYPIDEEYNIFDHPYYLLSIHQGCDVRGGYTDDVLVKRTDEYWTEQVYGSVTLKDDTSTSHPVSNMYDGDRITFDEHPTLQDSEINPDTIDSINLSIC